MCNLDLEKSTKLVIEKDHVLRLSSNSENTQIREQVGTVVVNYINGVAILFHKEEFMPERSPGDGDSIMALVDFVRYGVSTQMVCQLEYIGGLRIVLSKIREVDKTKMRKHPRVDVKLSYRIRKLLCTNSTDKSGEEIAHLSDRLVNLSEGGFLFYCWDHISEGTYLMLELDIPDQGVISARSVVVRSIVETDNQSVYGIAVMFENLSIQSRNKISKFVMSRQRQLIKQGKVPETI